MKVFFWKRRKSGERGRERGGLERLLLNVPMHGGDRYGEKRNGADEGDADVARAREKDMGEIFYPCM